MNLALFELFLWPLLFGYQYQCRPFTKLICYVLDDDESLMTHLAVQYDTS